MILSTFGIVHEVRYVDVRLRYTGDLRDPKRAHKYKRLRECTRHIGRMALTIRQQLPALLRQAA